MPTQTVDYFVLCLSASQLAAGIWGLAGSRRALQWAALICPIAILAILAARWQWSIPWATLRSAEIAFIAVNVVSAAVAIGTLRAATAPLVALWGHWLINSLLCGAMVFLAFFFRLF